MAIVRWSSSPRHTRDLFGIQDEVTRLFDSLYSRVPFSNPSAVTPPADIEEHADEFVVRVDLPGVPQKDVKVTLMADTLTIRGERRNEADIKEGNLHRVERAYGSFERSFTLGASVRNDKVRAIFRDGVLEVHVPKAEEARVREIEVQAS